MESLINIDKALQIEGMMDLAELEWLAIEAMKHRRIVELGSYLGRSTRALADNTKGRVMAIDDWLGPRDVLISNSDRLLIIDKFKQNIKDLLQNNKVTIHRQDFRFLSKIKFNKPPDMIFIDGDHSYESVIRDIEWAVSSMKDGGLLCGHDIDMPKVKRAIYDKFKFSHVTIPKDATFIWSVQLIGKHYGAMDSMKNGEIVLDSQIEDIRVINN
jgi:predicted O-methyltransferase YrrM